MSKTHLPRGPLTLMQIESSYGANFIKAYGLMEDLKKVSAEEWLLRRCRV